MDGSEDQDLEELAFSALLTDATPLPEGSLLDLTGDHSLASPDFDSGLTQRVAAAWVKPMQQLTCAEVCMLVRQKIGMKWLSAPVVTFVRAMPTAECRHYPGDMTLAALQAHAELLHYAPSETRAWLSGDFHWIDGAFDFHKGLPNEARLLLVNARNLAKASPRRL